MPDNRVRVQTRRKIDLAALDAALGGHGLSASPTQIVVAEGSPVTQDQLQAAIDAYQAPAAPPDPDDALATALAKTTDVAGVSSALRQWVAARKAARGA